MSRTSVYYTHIGMIYTLYSDKVISSVNEFLSILDIKRYAFVNEYLHLQYRSSTYFFSFIIRLSKFIITPLIQ